MRIFNSGRIIYFLLASCLVAVFLFFSYNRTFDEFEYSTYDFRYRLRATQDVAKDIVIVEIDDKSIRELGKWPFPRNYHALLVKALKGAGVKTIVFDIFFSEKKEGDEEFAETVKEAGNVYIPYVFELDVEWADRTCIYAKRFAAPLIEILKSAVKGSGFVNVDIDKDGKIRRFSPFIEYEGKFYPHLAVIAALNDLGHDFFKAEIIPAKEIVIDEGLRIPLDNNSCFLVNYPAKWAKSFRHYSYSDILQSYLADITTQEAPIDLKELEGTVCFIGMTATASPDTHPSPLEPLYPGIGVHASAYNGIFKMHFLERLNRWWNLAILIFMWLITAYITVKSRRRFALLSIFFIVIIFAAVATLTFLIFGKWIDVFYPIVTVFAVYIVFTFKKYMAEIYRRELMERELTIAKEIQESFLPQEIPSVGGLDVKTRMITAQQVGGDLYDVIKLDDKRLGVMIGDVSGKGVPAALFMAKVVTMLKIFSEKGAAQEVLKNANERLVVESGSNLFVTLTYMIFDTQTNTVTFAIGGHLPTILVSPQGELELLRTEEGMPLGLMESNYTLGKKEYRKGSIFLLYSDGVTEAMNSRREMFGDKRLFELVKGLKGRSAGEVIDVVNKKILDFTGKTKQYDDITVVAIKT